MEKKSPGRPRLYETASDKLGAFRKRLEGAGYQRREILVTKETWEQVSALAQAHGVGASDAASGLLEHGLRAFAQATPSIGGCASAFVNNLSFAQSFAPPNPGASMSGSTEDPLHTTAIRSFVSASAALPPTHAPSTPELVNPITQFFAKRKESLHG